MRLSSIVLLSTSVLLPLTVEASGWPAGKKAGYMNQCVQVAMSQGIDAKTADQHCQCGANAIEKNFTTQEIEALDSKDGVDAKLMMRAQVAVSQSCAPRR